MKHMHMRMYLPVLITLILFPIASFIIFMMSSRQYFRYQAVRDTDRLYRVIQDAAQETYRGAPALSQRTPEQERGYSHDLLNDLRDRLQKDNLNAFMIAINSRMKLSYPFDETVAPSVQMIYTQVVRSLEAGELSETEATEISTPDGGYIVHMLEIPSQSHIRGKYLISYAPISDGAGLMLHSGRLLLGITLACLVISAVIIWFVTGGIVRPLESLCRHTARIGEGDYGQIEETYSITEIEQLKDSVNQMADRIKTSQEDTRSFFQNVSHDLRTPLTSIIAYAQGIQSGVVKDTGASARIILSEGERMMNLIESILMLSRMDSRALQLHPVSIPLREFIQEQLCILQGNAGGRRFVFSADDPELYICTDPQLLIRIFQNIISNCSRYAEHDIEISLESRDDGIVIQIEDDGPGISDEELTHVFDRFYKGEGGNMGIGLSVVRSGMEYLGGSVTLTSKQPPLHGAVYRLYFPCEDMSDCAAEPTT